MVDGYDSPEVRNEHEKELIAAEQAKLAMSHFISTLSKPNFQLNQSGESIYAKPNPEDADNLKLAEDLNTIRCFIAGKHLQQNRYRMIEIKVGLSDRKSGTEDCFETLVVIDYEIGYMKRLREEDPTAPGEGDINSAVDMSIPGVKLGDASLRLNISNDSDGNVLKFSIERPNREQIRNPEVISEEPIDLSPLEQRLQLIQ